MRSISRKVTVRVLSRYSIASWPYLCEMQPGWAWEIGGHILLGQRGHKVTVSSQNLWACSACCSWFGFALAGVLCGQVGWSPPILTLTLWWHSEFSSICSSILLCLFEVLLQLEMSLASHINKHKAVLEFCWRRKVIESEKHMQRHHYIVIALPITSSPLKKILIFCHHKIF